MPLNPDAVGTVGEPTERSWTSTDCLLYAVSVGCGADDPLDELAFTTENSQNVTQHVLPTYAVILGVGGGAMRSIGTFNPAMLVHAGQGVTLHQPIPVEGRVRTVGRITAIEDKGSGALVSTAAESVDAGTGEPMFTTTSSVFIRGEGGFGGERAPSGAKPSMPDRDPDHVVTYRTAMNQALVYRLCGDRNPLHADPAFAAAGGFDRPILHGLCTYGFTGRALLHALCDSDPKQFGSMDARFSRPVVPGDTLTVSMWVDDDGTGAAFRTSIADGTVVIDGGRFQKR